MSLSKPQIELALLDQTEHPSLKLGEILALRGWLKQETADFFAEQWPALCQSNPVRPLVYYLCYCKPKQLNDLKIHWSFCN